MLTMIIKIFKDYLHKSNTLYPRSVYSTTRIDASIAFLTTSTEKYVWSYQHHLYSMLYCAWTTWQTSIQFISLVTVWSKVKSASPVVSHRSVNRLLFDINSMTVQWALWRLAKDYIIWNSHWCTHKSSKKFFWWRLNSWTITETHLLTITSIKRKWND